MTSMIERVARAIYAEFAEEDGYPAMSPAGKARWDAQARAAIEAMREPSEMMQREGLKVRLRHLDGEPSAGTDEIWTAMITAALSENDG